jgi:hypothetical protein
MARQLPAAAANRCHHRSNRQRRTRHGAGQSARIVNSSTRKAGASTTPVNLVVIAAAGSCLAIAIFSYVAIWAAYGFRYSATPDPKITLNLDETLRQCAIFSAQAAAGGDFNNEVYEKALLSYVHWYATEFAPGDAKTYQSELIEHAKKNSTPWEPPRSVKLALALMDHKLAPEAWLHGLIFVQARSYIRGSYLDGDTSVVGFTSYFPKAMAYKTALSTIVACAGAIAIGVIAISAWSRGKRSNEMATDVAKPKSLWLLACLGVPALIYMWMSMASNLNIGLRHVLPVYPWIYVGVAVAVASAWRRWMRPTAVVAGALAFGVAVESFAIAPDYLTFFNVAAGGQRGGLNRLGDSNLDWGQDLPAVAAWQARNPDVPLYFSYFGMVDPAFYKIRYLNMPGGYQLNPQAFEPPPGSVIAVSATNLQCMYVPTPLLPMYQRLREMAPAEVLNGTIYIYDLRKKK